MQEADASKDDDLVRRFNAIANGEEDPSGGDGSGGSDVAAGLGRLWQGRRGRTCLVGRRWRRRAG